MFGKTTPEKAGISSKNVLEFIKGLEKYRLMTHSIIMAKGNEIFAECYYEPFDSEFEHRMYSVSKSFVAVAVGLAVTEKIIKLEDKIIDYFPEYRNENTDELYDETTIEDMLTMQSNVASFVQWWGKYDDRIRSYYQNKSTKLPGTMFWYDSVGSYLLGCIVEKLTGKTFLDYLKEKVLYDMGFSKESHTLFSTEGYTLGDSGVICTARDLLIFARFLMNLGEYNGKQYIDREFMKKAITTQVDNDVEGSFAPYKTSGYGYLIWTLPDDGFALLGMGDQLAICDTKHDFVFVITSDNQADTSTSRMLIFHELYKTVIDQMSDSSLNDDPVAYELLENYTKNCRLVSVSGSKNSSIADCVNGKQYELTQNPIGIEYFKLHIGSDNGELEFYKNGEVKKLSFGMCENVLGFFPENERNSDIAAKMIEGKYSCATSAAWVRDNKFVIKSQIIDTYFGCVNFYIEFKDNSVTLLCKKSGQYLLDEYNGYAVGKQSDKKH